MNIRNTLIVGAIGLLPLAITATPSRMIVSIDKFENKANVQANQFETLRARIQQAVIGTRKYEVVEREQLASAMSEQNLVAAGVVDGTDVDAPQAGKMKAAAYVIYGNILFYGIDTAGRAAGGVGSGSIRTKVEVQIKITNAETGKILASKSVIGIGTESRQYQADTAVSGNIQEQCERAAVDQAAHMVVDALRDVSYPAKIVKVGRKSVKINMTNEEVREDDVFDVFEVGEEMIDPDTGASLGSEGEEVGRIRITRTGPKVSDAVPEDDLEIEDLKVGYMLRRVSAETLMKERMKAKKKRQDAFEARF